ncbi:MAG: methylmalonyl-CoA mutase family protein, partial [Syntrophothermus sp.]
QRKTVIIGTNQYPNLNENMLEEIQKTPSREEVPSTYKKLKRYRGPEGFESLRMETEKRMKSGNQKPRVFLLTIGNPAMRKARATFATNFFGCAGFEIIDNAGFKTAKEGIAAALESKAGFVVICSSDEEYATLVPAIASGIKSAGMKTKVIVAGYPKEILEELKKAGVDDFIHIRSNVLETLKKYQSEL